LWSSEADAYQDSCASMLFAEPAENTISEKPRRPHFHSRVAAVPVPGMFRCVLQSWLLDTRASPFSSLASLFWLSDKPQSGVLALGLLPAPRPALPLRRGFSGEACPGSARILPALWRL
jgi:hypothetical protein